MTQRKQSKEELFLKRLYELAQEAGDAEAEVDRYAVGEVFGGHTRNVDNIVQVLTKNNFIKKSEENLIYLTPLGITFIQENLC